MSKPSEQLLADARNYLDRTWEDTEGDRKLLGILSRGMARLDHIAGAEQDYEGETTARALLFDYCRYVLAGALQDFERDFGSELMGLRMDGEVARHEEEGTDL